MEHSTAPDLPGASPAPAARSSVIEPVRTRRSGLNTFGWVMSGLLGSLVFGAFGTFVGLATFDIDEDFAIVGVAFFAVVFYLIGIVLLSMIGLLFERANRSASGQRGRAFLAFSGAVLPLCLVLFAVFGTQLIMGG